MKTSNKILLTAYLVGLACFAGFLMSLKANMIEPESVEGNGNVVTIEKTINSYLVHLEVKDNFETELVPSATPFLKVTADENLQEYVMTSINGEELTIKTSNGFRIEPTIGKVKLTIGIGQGLKQVQCNNRGRLYSDSLLIINDLQVGLSGSTSVDLNIESQNVQINSSGNSEIKLSGKSENLNASFSGSGRLFSTALQAENVSIHISGWADAKVNANQSLNAHVSGSGKINYTGNPSINRHISGAGIVSPL